MSRKKRERIRIRNNKAKAPRIPRERSSQKKTQVATPEKSADLRTARPVRRIMGQVKLHALGIQGRCATIATWTRPKGEGAIPNPLVLEAHAALCLVVEGFPKFFAAMQKLDEAGFSPPRKSFTASTKEGDRVTVLESFRDRYADFMLAEQMIDLLVEKKYSGKGGGLVVISAKGDRMKVAKCHVVKLS